MNSSKQELVLLLNNITHPTKGINKEIGTFIFENKIRSGIFWHFCLSQKTVINKILKTKSFVNANLDLDEFLLFFYNIYELKNYKINELYSSSINELKKRTIFLWGWFNLFNYYRIAEEFGSYQNFWKVKQYIDMMEISNEEMMFLKASLILIQHLNKLEKDELTFFDLEKFIEIIK